MQIVGLKVQLTAFRVSVRELRGDMVCPGGCDLRVRLSMRQHQGAWICDQHKIYRL